MAASYKCVSKTRPREKCPRVTRQEIKVTLTPPSWVTLALPTTTLQEIFIVLTVELKRLRQQLSQPAKDKTLANTTATERFVRRKVTQCGRKQKQTVHKCNGKANIVYCNCQNVDRDRVPSKFFKGDNPYVQITGPDTSASPGDAFSRNVNKPTPAASTPAGKTSYTNVGGEMSTQDRLCLSYQPVKVITVNTCAFQTEPMKDTRGINTKLRGRQTRLEAAEQVFHPREKEIKQQKRRLFKKPGQPVIEQENATSRLGEITEQEPQQLRQEKPVDKEKQIEAVEEVAIKIPQNSSELVTYTLQRIDDLIQRQLIHKPRELQNFCVFCHKNHNVAYCQVFQEKNEAEKKYSCPLCYICRESTHDLVSCRLTEVIDLATSLNKSEQEHLERVCPYLRVPNVQ